MEKNIPVTLICGFLGAGKSTLVNRLTATFPERQIGIIVNELGTVKLESQIIQAQADDIVELPGACMCCELRGDLSGTVRGFLDRRPDMDHLLVESSGLSDPFPIAQTFLHDDMDGRTRFDAVVTVVDASNFESTIAQFSTCIKQLRLADFVLLSKTDGLEALAVERVRHRIGLYAKGVPILDAQSPDCLGLLLDTHELDHIEIARTPLSYGKAPALALRAGTAAPRTNGSGGGIRVSHRVEHDSVQTLFLSCEEPLDHRLFYELLEGLPASIVRIKGFLWTDAPAGEHDKTIIQSVAGRNSVEFRDWSPGERRQSAIVFIGRDFDEAAVRSAFEACVLR